MHKIVAVMGLLLSTAISSVVVDSAFAQTGPVSRGETLLRPVELWPNITQHPPGKPTVAEFISRTNVDFETAGEILSGVVGAGVDSRDWVKIMAAQNVLAAARQATAQMLNSPTHATEEAKALQAKGYSPIQPSRVAARSGNFIALVDQGPNNTKVYSLAAIGANGYVSRGFGWNVDQLLYYALNANLDLKELAPLADQLDALNVPYRPYELYPGTGSDHGVDLRDLAAGGIGTAYDWLKVDPECAKKGPGACDRENRQVRVAQELGLKINPRVTNNHNFVDVELLQPTDHPFQGRRNWVVVRGSTVSWHGTEIEARQVASSLGGVAFNIGNRPVAGSDNGAYVRSVLAQRGRIPVPGRSADPAVAAAVSEAISERMNERNAKKLQADGNPRFQPGQPEFENAMRISPKTFVIEAYHEVLRRDPDLAGLNSWTAEIVSGRMTPAQVKAALQAGQTR